MEFIHLYWLTSEVAVCRCVFRICNVLRKKNYQLYISIVSGLLLYLRILDLFQTIHLNFNGSTECSGNGHKL